MSNKVYCDSGAVKAETVVLMGLAIFSAISYLLYLFKWLYYNDLGAGAFFREVCGVISSCTLPDRTSFKEQ